MLHNQLRVEENNKDNDKIQYETPAGDKSDEKVKIL